MDKKKILFLFLYPLCEAPNQRFRAENYLPELEGSKYRYDINSFMDEQTWHILYTKNNKFRKVVKIFNSYIKRLFFILINIKQYEYVFIMREAAPLGPPIFEWIIAKVFQKKIIYDFDDAIWIENKNQNIVFRILKSYWKVRIICKWSYKVVCGNQYLADYALKYNVNVVLIPTCVDTQDIHNKVKNQLTEKIVIGWTGSHSTMAYLDIFIPIYKKLLLQYANIELVIISNRAPVLNEKSIKFIKWNEQSEIEDLLKINIGIMPLTFDAWSEGKCGFKLIQYLSLGIPAVASPVGVNKIIIDQNNNGFLCTTQEEWYSALTYLINNEVLRIDMGKRGRTKMQQEYCIHVYKEKFKQLFN